MTWTRLELRARQPNRTTDPQVSSASSVVGDVSDGSVRDAAHRQEAAISCRWPWAAFGYLTRPGSHRRQAVLTSLRHQWMASAFRRAHSQRLLGVTRAGP